MNTFGDVYLRCPLSGETLWFDWMSYEAFQRKVASFPNLLWVAAA